MKAGIASKAHLGDKIMCCIALYNQSLSIKKQIQVSCDETSKDIIRLLNFQERLQISEFSFNANLSIKDFVFGLEKTEVICLNQKLIYLDHNPIKIKKAALPKNTLKFEEKTFFQMDNRSQHQFKKPLKRTEQLYWLRELKSPIGIGGKDTEKSLPFFYELYDLEGVIQKMKTARKFVGVDSGISHIAGVLGINSKVIITHTRKKDVSDICLLYAIFYEKTFSRGRLKAF